MSFRQKEKSEMTHQEIKSASLKLFLEKGYKNTSIQDIVTESGYSTGSFYNHYKTKREVLTELWNEHAISFISRAIDEIKCLHTPQDLAEYLIDNSNAFDHDEKTVRLAQAAQEDLVMVGKNYENVRKVSRLYQKQIAVLLATFCPFTDEKTLFSHASLLNAIQHSHSEVTRKKVGFVFDDETVKNDILLLIKSWIEKDLQKVSSK